MKEKMMKAKHFVPSSYLLFFWIVFLVSFYLTFPDESIRQRIMSEIEARTNLRADIKKVSLSPIFSLKIYDMKVYKADEQLLNIDELKIRPSLFSLFSDSMTLPFKARALGGETNGTLIYSKQSRHIENAEVNMSAILVENIIPFIPVALGNKMLSMQGFLGGNFSLALNPEPRGEFTFDISKLGIKNLRVRGFVFPEFINMESSLRGKIERDLTKIESLKLEGDGVDLTLAGTMPLVWKLKKGGVIDLGLKLQLTG
ncbi:MAG TPA: type II secretion system protein GspN, partial [Thermodesulfobacteriota bacterium]|nr:type II secretion system protein GspN [Thermodesulfobacteriota bacterium]